VFQSLKRVLLAAAVVMAAPSVTVAQGAPAATDPAQLEVLFDEFQELHTKLESIQMKALEDPALGAEQAQLGEQIQQAMMDRDPSLADRVDRADALEAEAISAQQSGDMQRLNELMVEAQQIQLQFMAVQQEVLSQPPLSDRLEAFQGRLERKMLELDPSTQSLIDRFRELEGILSAAMAGA
jgi:hypothetical protein